MVQCLICNKNLGMITASHMEGVHRITCKEYADKFGIKKGELNPHHSQYMTGKGNPRYGATISIELRNKISHIHKSSGRFKGSGNPMYGKTHTPEVRLKLSEFNKIAVRGERNPFYGKKHTSKTKKHISRIRIEAGIAKGENNPLYGRGHTKETRERMSKFLTEFFKKHPEKHINSIIAKNYKKQKNKKGGYISKKQIELYKIVKKRFKDAKLNYPIITEKGNYFADIGIPSLKLDVEYDGAYWHREKLKEVVRDNNIRQNGWVVLRINEKQVATKDHSNLADHVLRLIESQAIIEMTQATEIELNDFDKLGVKK